MSAASLYPVRPEVAARTLTDEATYKAMYQQSVVNPEGFWREQGKRIDWILHSPDYAALACTDARAVD